MECIIQNMYVNTNICICIQLYSHGVIIQNMYVNTNICICIQLYSHGVFIQNMYVNTNICICIQLYSHGVLYRICMLIQTYVYVYSYTLME